MHRAINGRPLRTSETGYTMESGEVFVVLGLVSGRPVAARWVNGALVANAALLDRAGQVVALGDHYTPDGGATTVDASLDQGPLAALLTMMQAFDEIVNTEIANDISNQGLGKWWGRSALGSSDHAEFVG